MHTIDKYFRIFNSDKCLLNAAFSHAQRLYLRTVQRNAALILFLNEIVMVRLFIICYQF